MRLTTLTAAVLLALTASAGADTLHRGVMTAPETLDPHLATGAAERDILRDMFEGFTTRGADGALMPGVAKDWLTLDDGLTWVFRMRRASWSNRDAVLPEDFVRAFRRLVDPAIGSPHAGLLAAVVGADDIAAGRADPETLAVEKLGPTAVRLRLSRPEPLLPVLLADPAASPIHADAIGDDGSLRVVSSVLTNGAFRLASLAESETVDLTKNANFHDADSVAIDGVVYETIGNLEEAVARIAAGTLQVNDGAPVHRLAEVADELGDRLRIAPYFGTLFLAVNLRDERMAVAETRRALSLAVNRTALADGAWGGTMVPAGSLVPPGLDGEAEAAMVPGFGVETAALRPAAEALLAVAGISDETPLTVSLAVPASEIRQAMAEALAANWSAIGVATEIVSQPRDDFYANLARGRFQLAPIGWIGDFADATAFLNLLASDNENLNFPGYDRPDYDALLAAAAVEPDSDARASILDEAGAMLAEDMPIIPLLHYASVSLIADGVDGWQDNVLNIHPSRFLSLAED